VASFLGKAGPRLKELHLWMPPPSCSFDPDTVVQILDAIPAVEVLTLVAIAPLPTKAISSIPNAFVRLDLKLCQFSDADLSILLSNSSQTLRHLGIYSTRKIGSLTRAGVASALQNSGAQLHSLALWDVFPPLSDSSPLISRDDYKELGRIFQACPELRVLDLDEGPYIGIRVLRCLPLTLESIHIAASRWSSLQEWIFFLETQGAGLAWREIWIDDPVFFRPSEFDWDEFDKAAWRTAFEDRGIEVLGLWGDGA
jgi:hypothetical protein